MSKWKPRTEFQIDNWNVLPTGTYPQDYIGLQPAIMYNKYYQDRIINHISNDYHYQVYEVPKTLNVNAAFVFEYWEKLPPEILPKEVKQEFYVSSFGRLYNKTRDLIKKSFIRKDGYVGFGFNSFIVPVHRIVLYTFCPRPDFKELTVNHKSFDVTENYLWNLEWSTMRENVMYSIDNGNRQNPHFLLGEDNNKATITNYQAEMVCRLLSTCKYNFYQISIMMGISERIVAHIAHRESFAWLHDKYNLGRLSFKGIHRSKDFIIGAQLVPEIKD